MKIATVGDYLENSAFIFKKYHCMMLMTRTILFNLRRTFGDSAGLTAELLCNEDNQIKCLERMTAATKNTTIKLHPSVKLASVLIPIVQCDKPNDEPSLLYTLRSNKMRKHISQVSFPGGIMEEHDESYIDCALRETEEEIGIERDRIKIWGPTHLVHLRSAPAIMPVVGVIRDYNKNLLKLNDHEVERVFTVPLSELAAQKRHTQFRMIPRNLSHTSDHTLTTAAYSLPVYTVNEARIWGITAMITHLFLQSLLPAQLYDKRIPFIKRYK